MFSQTLHCPAKVNWTLKVGPKKSSGFHQVETLMLALDLYDTLQLVLDPTVPKGEMQLAIRGPARSVDIPLDASNLVLRAARLVAQKYSEAYFDLPCGLTFELEKNIPSQAGLGGGSSNAAAAAYALALGLGIELANIEVESLLAELGSDCPFFAHVLGHLPDSNRSMNAALGFDQGQRILAQTDPVPDLRLCVITPDVGCPTGAIYGALESRRIDLQEAPGARPWCQLEVERCNDLEAAAILGVPGLKPWRQAFTDFDSKAFQLSGSGASFYGVIPQDQEPGPWMESLLAHLGRAGLQPRFHWCGSLWSNGHP